MRLLALDSSSSACSAAVWSDGAIAAHRRLAGVRGQAEALMPLILETLAEAGLDFAALDAFAVSVGPGAFTGLRIGLATARGLALAADKPLLGVTCFEAVAAAVPETERAGRVLAVVLDTKRADLYVQIMDDADAPMTLMAQDLASRLPAGPLLLAGDAAPTARAALVAAGREAVLSAAPGGADAAWVARIAAARWPDRGVATAQPLYLRPPDAVIPTAGGRLRP